MLPSIRLPGTEVQSNPAQLCFDVGKHLHIVTWLPTASAIPVLYFVNRTNT